MIVALHFCAKDGALAIKNLNFCIYLEGSVPFDALISYDTETPEDMIGKVRGLAQKYFRKVEELQYQAPWHKGWPQAANHAFQQTASHISLHIREPFLWWEADAVPLRKGWLTDIAATYEKALRANKCFMGNHVVGITAPIGHMNGVGVYPADVGKFSRNAMLSLNAPWDVAMAGQMMNHLYPANELFQHCWSLDGAGNCCNNGQTIPTFTSWNEVSKGPHRVDFRAALFHRCKDGSIIDHWMGKAAAASVPQHMHEKVKEIALRATKKPPGPKPPGPTTRILIVTYWKDFPWLKLCLDAIEKFASGFSGVTVCIPTRDMEQYGVEIGARDNVRIRQFAEVEGKGMVHHMERMAYADQLCPKDDFILHMDADCIFTEPVTPDDYVVDGKAVYVIRTYQSLINSDGVISDCYQWKKVAERALGEEIDMYTMCRHPTCFPRSFYPMFREHIEKVHGVPFTDFVLAQKNTFPQGFADFPTMGAFAWAHQNDAYHWLDIAKDGAPKDKVKAFHSHSSLDQIMPDSGKSARLVIQEVLTAYAN